MAGQITVFFLMKLIRRGGGSKILYENFLQPALTARSRQAPRWGQPKAVKKIFLRKIFDCSGIHRKRGYGGFNPHHHIGKDSIFKRKSCFKGVISLKTRPDVIVR
jgi:hypothetical protein